jgi:hypothetical protein
MPTMPSSNASYAGILGWLSGGLDSVAGSIGGDRGAVEQCAFS